MKHDHKKTKKLKIALFSMFMFLPFIAIGVTCLTHVFNKEVAEETQTATINYMYETNNPQETGIIRGNIYKINANCTKPQFTGYDESNDFSFQLISGNITWDNGYLETDEIYPYEENEIHPTKTFIYISMEIISFNLKYYGGYDNFTFDTESNFTISINGTIVFYDLNNIEDTTSKLLSELQECPQNEIPIESVTITTNPQDQTTNIFYDSCTQVQQSFILNWCNTTNPLRNTLNNFTQIVGLPNNHLINDLLTYWLSITIIYIVIDIILELVIYLTHMFNKEV